MNDVNSPVALKKNRRSELRRRIARIIATEIEWQSGTNEIDRPLYFIALHQIIMIFSS